MTDLRDAARQALEALETVFMPHHPAVIALKAALAEEALQRLSDANQEIEAALEQPEQEPVAWLYPEGLEALQKGKCWTAYGTKQDAQCSVPVYLNGAVAPRVEPAQAECAGFDSQPAPRREWRGLTDPERAAVQYESFKRGLSPLEFMELHEAKLREKNHE